MGKLIERTVETVNIVLRVVIPVFLIFAVFIRISTIAPAKEADPEAISAESAADMEDGDAAGIEGSDGQYAAGAYEKKEYGTIEGFTVNAKNAKKSAEKQTDEDPADEDEFMFPDSYMEKLSASDVRKLETVAEVQDAINYIYARAGCMFQDEEKQAYFEQFDWYEGNYSVDEMNQNPLEYMSEVQYKNIELLAKRRSKLNGS